MSRGFRRACWLIRNGVSAEIAFALDGAEALAFAVAFGEIESGGKAEYDFYEGEWRGVG